MDQETRHIRFFSRNPYGHLGRVLDLLRKMDFELTELRMTMADGVAEIAVSFVPRGHHRADALLQCLGQLVGVAEVAVADLAHRDLRRSSNGARSSSSSADAARPRAAAQTGR